tara:strand:+ start:298 stop:681 length:384 start_codon:yes stop_codon:yes gene_type:complete
MDAHERLNAINEGIRRIRRIQTAIDNAERGIAGRVEKKVNKIVSAGGLNRGPGAVRVTRGDMVFRETQKEKNNPRLEGLKGALEVAKDKLKRRDNRKLKDSLEQQRMYKTHPDNPANRSHMPGSPLR